MSKNYIQFDWAMKRLLRQKDNFVVLEGFLSCLLGNKITIQSVLESEGNKETAEDKYNRVDILVKDSNGTLVIIEVQNYRELDYFHRMLYGVSKVIAEYITEGRPYSEVKKVYSVNIVYIDLGEGTDNLYHGTTDFRGVHDNDRLRLSCEQQEKFSLAQVSDVFPEYYILRLNARDREIETPLDEWISFLKTSEIPDTTNAPGLPEARERLRRDTMLPAERREYDAHYERLRLKMSLLDTEAFYQREAMEKGEAKGRAEGEAKGRAEGEAKGRAEGRAEGEAERQQLAKTIEAKDAALEAKDAVLDAQAREIAELRKLVAKNNQPQKNKS